MHTSIAGGMIGIMLVLLMIGVPNMMIPLVVVIAIAALIGRARVWLGAHERGDIWLGYVVGILVQLGAYLYMK